MFPSVFCGRFFELRVLFLPYPAPTQVVFFRLRVRVKTPWLAIFQDRLAPLVITAPINVGCTRRLKLDTVFQSFRHPQDPTPFPPPPPPM